MGFPYLRTLVALALICSARAQFANFETQQTRPICLSPDGTRLFAVNTPDGRLSVFDVSNPANPAPVLIAEISVGLEPVSVNALSSDEAWVVNEVGDSVSVVSVAQGATIATLAAKDEPGDVVFAGGQAFVSCSRSNAIRVFDTATFAEVTPAIALEGLYPRALAVSNDGTKVYAAIKFSGNKTTLLHPSLAPPQPPPTNAALPPPPRVGLIVPSNDARLQPPPNMPDNDVAEIAVSSRTVARYFKGVGTINFAIAARPGTDELWVANTEARNLIRFEPVLKGHLVDNRVTRIATTPAAGAITPFDLNPTIDYTVFPDTAGQAVALAQPTSIAFEAPGAYFWVAAFGSDRIARVDAATGAVVARIETGPADPRSKRGTRGLALQTGTGRLYALNRISNTITVISTTTASVLAEGPIGSFDPTPAVIREGRGFLYDARLSGNGTQSCASCHIDGDRDDLAWDLGDPGGSMQQVVQNNPPPLPGTTTFNFHPMKGPMNTQTLRGISGTQPLHWRADRADFTAFNGAFASLLGGTMLSTADMNAFRDFINTVLFQPNPNQNLDRTLPATFAGGDPSAGRNTYMNTQYQIGLTCNTCHALPTGTNRLIIPGAALQESQDFKVPQLRNAYQKLFSFKSATTPSLGGFGLVHDGQSPDVPTFLTSPVFGAFAAQTPAGATIRANLNAFVQCFDTGTAPSVGYARTGTVAAMSADWTTLAAQAAVAGTTDLIVQGVVDGMRHSFRYRPATNDYVSDQAGYGPFTRAQLEAKISAGAVLTILGVPVGTGVRAIDRDADGILDGDKPLPALEISLSAGLPQLAWPAADSSLVLEYSDSLSPSLWQPVLETRAGSGAKVMVLDPGASVARFYRLRRP